jgi:SAM-dependent methyltransferase
VKYPDWSAYELLYARYVDAEKSKHLLDLAEPIAGKDVLDLCGGSGKISFGALARDAKSVDLVDQEPDMVDPAILNSAINFYFFNVERFLSNSIDIRKEYDIVVCQQGINYWFNKNTADDLAQVIRRGGIFVFNTFANKPTWSPIVKQYTLNGNEYSEMTWLDFDGENIHHVQIMEGLPFHMTQFRWISEDYFKVILSSYFDVQIERRNKTLIFKCIRK